MKVYLAGPTNHMSLYGDLGRIFPEAFCDWVLKQSWYEKADKIWQKVFNWRRSISYIKIDRWDSWSVDYTIAQVMVPLLKQLRDTTHGYPPEFISEMDENGCPVDDSGAEKWKEIINKMIWSMESIVKWGNGEEIEGYYTQEYQDKVQEGCELMGKYFQNLWD